MSTLVLPKLCYKVEKNVEVYSGYDGPRTYNYIVHSEGLDLAVGFYDRDEDDYHQLIELLARSHSYLGQPRWKRESLTFSTFWSPYLVKLLKYAEKFAATVFEPNYYEGERIGWNRVPPKKKNRKRK